MVVLRGYEDESVELGVAALRCHAMPCHAPTWPRLRRYVALIYGDVSTNQYNGLMSQQTTVTDAELEVWRSFYSMRRTFDRALDLQLQRDSSISAPEYELLLILHHAPQHQLRIKAITDTLGWEKGRVSHQVTRTEKRGLLERAECEMDARGSWIRLTADGCRAVLGAPRGHAAAIGCAASEEDDTEKETQEATA